MDSSRALNGQEALWGNTLNFLKSRPGKDIKYFIAYPLQEKDFLGALNSHTCLDFTYAL